jgi:ribosomal protein S12 methylthiotransferase accessory factor
MSPHQACDSCIGEALEFYSIAYRGNEKMNRAHLADMPAGIDPRNILLYSEAQYESRRHSNQFLSERHRIPETFDCARPLDWLPGIRLADGKPAWVPAACCLLHYQYRPDEPKFAVADRAGCAAGASYSDALAGALLELIEHDAVAIWWYNQIQRPEIEIESFDSPVILAVRDAMATLKRKLWILDVSTDIGIPAYLAVSTLNDGRELLFGSAANPSPKIAAEKAATEVAHLWMCMRIATMPTDFIPWLRTATLKNQPYFVPSGRVASLPEPDAMTSADIVGLCTERLRRSRLDPIAINLTRSDVMLHAVRAVVPGIRYTRNRRAPGRLYDLPVKLGWLQKPRLETELNPICCVF